MPEMKAELKAEIESINKAKRAHPEVRETSTKLISKLKSEAEGRGKVKDEELNRYRKAFWAMVAALSETDGET